MSAAEEFLSQAFPDAQSSDCVAFIADNQTHDVVANVTRQFFNSPLVRDGGSSEALQYISESNHPDVLIVDISDSSDPVSAMLSLTTAFPEQINLIGLGTLNDITLYRELIEAGVTDYLVKPISERNLASALSRLDEPPEEVMTEDGEGTKIAVIGTRGGVGATSVAVNLAWILGEEHKRKTVLVDLDLWFGTAALSFDLEPTRGLREALENPSRIDGLFLSSATSRHTDNVFVMAAEEALAGEMVYNTGAAEILIEFLSHSYPCAVLDLPRSAFRMRHPVLAAANHVALVTELSLPGLRDAIRLCGAIEDASAGTPITVVANRCGTTHQSMSAMEFQKALGHKVSFQIPEDPKSFKQASNTGKPVVQSAPRTKSAKIFRQMADRFSQAQADTAKSSLLKGLVKRR